MSIGDYIRLDHGSGGKLSHRLIEEIFLPHFLNDSLKKLDDSAVLKIDNKKFAFTTDSYVIDPIFFPGGSIGKLSICGTINDLSMSGAVPIYISAGFIIEEGFDLGKLEEIVISMKETADEAGVEIVTGDTKIVPYGNADKIFINTAGIGIIPDGVDISSQNAKPGDKILINGFLGDHGIAVISQREGLDFQTEIKSDVAPLNSIIRILIESEIEIHTLRDPTRGGLATSLNEIADKSNMGIIINEIELPFRKEVIGACELLGFDPLYIANEGKFIAFIPEKDSERALNIVKNQKYGENARIIGEVVNDFKKKVILKTKIGGRRIVDMLTGEQLPRIC
ncbi:hydrogenase expression/formation protein HypE [candidate division KSB1 bacterium]|nr:MAG: hydrogenase expression/formation protein HypE [candidate division KSB1 bacterium]